MDGFVWCVAILFIAFVGGGAGYLAGETGNHEGYSQLILILALIGVIACIAGFTGFFGAH